VSSKLAASSVELPCVLLLLLLYSWPNLTTAELHAVWFGMCGIWTSIVLLIYQMLLICCIDYLKIRGLLCVCVCVHEDEIHVIC
jgi:hypothetical protein